MRWFNYRSSERTRKDKPVPRGIIAISETGAMRVGDGHTLLADLEDVGGAVDTGGSEPGVRVVRQTLTHATSGIEDGIVLTTLAYGEKVIGVRVGVEEAWDGLYLGDPAPAGIKIGTTADDDCFSGGLFTMENVDSEATGDWTGLLNSNVLEVEYITQGSGYGPPDGIDIVATIDDGAGNASLATTGISHVVLFIQAGFVAPT